MIEISLLILPAKISQSVERQQIEIIVENKLNSSRYNILRKQFAKVTSIFKLK